MFFNFLKIKPKKLPKIIILIGSLGVGKTLFGSIIAQELKPYNYTFYLEYTPEEEKQLNSFIRTRKKQIIILKNQKEKAQIIQNTLNSENNQSIIIETFPYWHTNLIHMLSHNENTDTLQKQIIFEINTISKKQLNEILILHIKVSEKRLLANLKQKITAPHFNYANAVQLMQKYDQFIKETIKQTPQINYKVIDLNKEYITKENGEIKYANHFIKKIISKYITL